MKRPIEGIIEEVIVEPTKIQPIIVNFQNGQLEDEEAKKMASGLFYDPRKKKTVLALSNKQIVYKGYRPDTEKELTYTMLVLHNRETGKVKLVQAERWHVCPVLNKPALHDKTREADEKISILNKKFGSKKVKRRTEQFERLKIDVESVKHQLEKTVSNVEIDRTDLSIQLSENEYITNTNLPTCNREATSVDEVYNIHEIIPENKLETLYEKAAEILNEDTEGRSKFFARTLKHLKSDPDNIKKVAILLYIQTVGNWLNMPIKDAKKRGIEICPESQEINTYVINTYSVASAHGRARPNSTRDKGLIHCIILGLTVTNFVLDLELFTTIFNNRVGLKKLTDLARIVGALPDKEDKKTITLKIPLPTQAAIVRKGKKK